MKMLPSHFVKTFKKYGPFLWIRFNCLKVVETRPKVILLLNRVPTTHLIDPGKMEDWADLGATQFWLLTLVSDFTQTKIVFFQEM